MTLLHLSDTHGKHKLLKNLPEADVIIHSGDVCFSGSEREVMDFMEWFFDLPFRYKIFIAGNHDNCLHEAIIEGLSDGCHYLCNSGIEIENVKFYGLPLFMEDITSGNYDANIRKIPADTDVLISHQPPLGILDLDGKTHYGDKFLLEKAVEIQARFHLFGHIHASYGTEKSGNTIFVNASVLNENYELTNRPVLLEYL